MLTQLRADTPLPVLWAWMLVLGIGMGPVFSVFALVVQNSVPISQIGAASSSVSFFQQVGGTVGLALTGTIFATSMEREVPAALAANGVPAEVGMALAGSGGASEALTGVGDTGAALLASVPPETRALVEPYVPAIVDAIHQAFSLATASTFTIGIATTVVAAGLALLFRDAPATDEERAWDGEAVAAY
jgi:hypothetical protein